MFFIHFHGMIETFFKSIFYVYCDNSIHAPVFFFSRNMPLMGPDGGDGGNGGHVYLKLGSSDNCFRDQSYLSRNI